MAARKPLVVNAGEKQQLQAGDDLNVDGGLIVNDSAADKDTRMEGVSTPLLFEVDAGQNSVKIGGSLSGTVAAFLQSGVTFNDETADRDFKIAGDTLVYMFWVDASAATENIAMLSVSAPNWQSMDRGLFIGDASTAPIGNPVAGVFVYSEAGTLKLRTGAGNVKDLGAPTSSTDNAISRYDGTGGTLQNSGVLIDDSNQITGLAAINGATLVINEPGDNIVALRVEGDTATNLLVVRGSNESVSIGTTLETAIALFRPVEIIFNEIGADLDFRVEGDTLDHMIFVQGDAALENIALLAAAAPNFQSMDRGLFIGAFTTAPIGNPTAGVFMWNDGDALKIRNPTGTTVNLFAPPPDIQAFNALGANTWTKPVGAVTVERHLIGGGGGGGSGRKGAAESARGGGGGGGGGGYSFDSNPASEFGATETVTIGARGTRGAAVTTANTNGNAGTAGGDTTMTATGTGGATLTAGGGGGGSGGTTAAGAGGAGGTTTGGEAGGAGGAGTAGSGNAAGGGSVTGQMAGAGGGGGGGLSAGDVVGNGENGGTSGGSGGSRGFGSSDNAIVAGDNGTPPPAFIAGTTPLSFGGGGGGGAVTSTGTAIQSGLGGSAGLYGAGGGGGAGTTNAVNHFNAGGFGAPGIAIVITFFE